VADFIAIFMENWLQKCN